MKRIFEQGHFSDIREARNDRFLNADGNLGNMSDDEVLESLRFVATGDGLKIEDDNIDEIEEV